MYYPLAVHLDYDPPIPSATPSVSAVSNCVLSHNSKSFLLSKMIFVCLS